MPILLVVAVACSFLQPLSPPTPFPTSTVPPSPTVQAPSPLGSLAEQHNFWIGSAASYEYLQSDELYCQLLAREFNLLTTENDLKFTNVHPELCRYDFEAADALVAFAQENGMAVRGHTLVWDVQNPAWLVEGDYTREELIDILRDHIYTVVGHYLGQITAWDVVIEALAAQGILWDTLWLRGIGPEYIPLAFQWAHEADPEAQLFDNEYSAERMNAKAESVYQLVKGLRDSGIPIDGVGMQMHIELYSTPPPVEVAANIARLEELGLQVQSAEMDVRVGSWILPQKLRRQSEIYRDMLSVCLQAENCDTLVVWGVSDRYSWLPELTGRRDAGTLFDLGYQPKPAFDGLVETLELSK